MLRGSSIMKVRYSRNSAEYIWSTSMSRSRTSSGQIRVALDIGVQHVLQHQFHLPRHAAQRGAGAVDRRVVHDRLGPLGDVLGIVADPFEVGGDAEHSQDGAQIARRWADAGR
jgi:hypothetical protein